MPEQSVIAEQGNMSAIVENRHGSFTAGDLKTRINGQHGEGDFHCRMIVGQDQCQSQIQGQLQQRHRDRVILCIGGQILETSKQTLCVDSRSMLAAWVLRHLGDGDAGGDRVLWIDRDARRFHHVLNYLRNGTIWLDDIASLRAVQEEAAFFGIAGLEALCEERIQEQETLLRKRTEDFQHVIKAAIADFCNDSGLFSPPRSASPAIAKGEVLTILRGRHLGSSDFENEPVFSMDEDF